MTRHIASIEGIVNEQSAQSLLMSATLSVAQLAALVRFDEVGYIDLWSQPTSDMVNARAVGGATFLALPANGGYTGRGVRGEVMDGNMNFFHDDWTIPGPPPISRVIRHGFEPGATDVVHGSATYGIAFGDGATRPSATGMLPGAGHGTDAEGGGIFATTRRLQQFGGSIQRADHTAELVGYDNNPTNLRAVFQSFSGGPIRCLSTRRVARISTTSSGAWILSCASHLATQG